jgi:hypothetical protein
VFVGTFSHRLQLKYGIFLTILIISSPNCRLCFYFFVIGNNL